MRSIAIRAFLLLISAGMVVPLAWTQADKYPTVKYKKADDHVGETVWVEGTVLKTLNEAEGTYLCFHNNKKYIKVLIPEQYLANFEGSFKHRYVGKKIKAIGKISKYGNQLIVGVSEPKRIRLVEKET
jgi:hypothetical protein